MVSQQEVDQLTQELQSLRGAVIRGGSQRAERLSRIQKEAHRLHEEAKGTAFEPALRSVENLLSCVERGLSAQRELNSTVRKAS